MLPSACLIKNISQLNIKQLFDINIRTIHRLSPAMSKFNLPERYVGNDKSVWYVMIRIRRLFYKLYYL